MDTSEYKNFCHEEFIKHGFNKQKEMYYHSSNLGLLCALRLQKSSYGAAYYINCYYFIGSYSNPKEYPSHPEFDLYDRPICVLSKDTYKGEHFMTALIEVEKYTVEELLPYFDQAFDEKIMPPLVNGKQELLMHIERWGFPLPFVKSKEEVMQKLYT